MEQESSTDIESVMMHPWLTDALDAAFGSLDKAFLQLMLQHLRWVHVRGGQTLFNQGDTDQTLYIVVGGRLRALLVDPSGEVHSLGDMRRGEILGEMALITGEPRTATIVAVRDSTLVGLSRTAYEQVISRFPLVSMRVAKFIIERIRPSLTKQRSSARPTVVTAIPASAGFPSSDFVSKLMPCLLHHGKVTRLDAASAQGILGADILIRAEARDPEAARAVSRWIDTMEADSDMVILVSDESASQWTTLCLNHADEIVFLADATSAPQSMPNLAPPKAESALGVAIQAHRTLVLLHPADTAAPRGTSAWLHRLPVDAHLHLRDGHRQDLQRLARTLFGAAIGLVFGGGGARGFAHLGVMKAMEEAGIPIDFVGGASIGAVMATYAAFDTPADRAIELVRRAFSRNPTGDLSFFPMISLINGKRLRAGIEKGIREATGFDADIEDAWKPLYCIASNYSLASEVVLRHGSLARSVRASVAIPAALPPVIMNGDLIIDGGTFNNFPTDVMARSPVGFIFGCDLSCAPVRKLRMEDVPSNWQLLLDRLLRGKNRRYRLPSLSSIILNVSIMHSQARLKAARAHADVCFVPDLGRIGMLNWKAFDPIVDLGYRHAREMIANLPASILQKLTCTAEPGAAASGLDDRSRTRQASDCSPLSSTIGPEPSAAISGQG